MTIESSLDRIATALEKIALAQSTAIQQVQQEFAPTSTPPGPAPVTAPAAPPVSPPPAGPGPAATPPTGGPPVGAPAAAPAAVPGAVPAPAPAAGPVGVPSLDDLRAAFNDFARNHQDKIASAQTMLAGHQAIKLEDLAPASYPQVLAQLKALTGG